MFKKNLLFGSGLLLIMAVILGSFPAATFAQQGDATKPNFVFVNYFGQDMVFDLDDVTYTIPGTATAPAGGRLELQLAPGEHKYAANIPGVDTGHAGTFVIEPGGYVGKAARWEKTNALLDRDGNVLEKPKDYVFVFDFDPFAAPAPQASTVDAWQPVAAAPGQGSIAWTNYNGDELTIDLNGTLYKVSPAANNIPGRLQINVAPGLYRYTASVPNGSLNGEINVVAGQVTGLVISAKVQPEPEYDIGEPSPLPLPVELQLSQEDLTAQAAPQGEVAPGELPTSGGVLPAVDAPTTAAPKGLLVKNYAGDTLILTINDQTYAITNNTSTTLSLPPGRYNYTASLPFVATTGTVDLSAGQGVELSIAINVNHDVLSVYQN
ncbi:MAG: hypothetical protein HYR94_19805 [Chloroflexi bacterium]|nr:hypothetical protein [Chloroflexota bacterium]